MENDEFILPDETNDELGLAALKTIESLEGVMNNFEYRSKEIDCSDRLKVLLKH